MYIDVAQQEHLHNNRWQKDSDGFLVETSDDSRSGSAASAITGVANPVWSCNLVEYQGHKVDQFQYRKTLLV